MLVCVDTFSGWVEAFPTAREAADTVTNTLLTHLIPQFGFPNSIQSDNRPAFVSQITQQIGEGLNISWH